MNQAIYEKLVLGIAEELSESDITPATTFGVDLKMSEADWAYFLDAVEDAFGIEISDAAAMACGPCRI